MADLVEPSRKYAKKFLRESLTKQSFKDECNINLIVKRFEKHQVLDHLAKTQGRYGDFLSAPDFHEAQIRVAAAKEAFASLPAAVRKRFNNDPGAFMSFATDPENKGELRKMGLLKAEAPAPQDKDLTAEAGSDVSDGEADAGRKPASQKRAKGAGGEGGA